MYLKKEEINHLCTLITKLNCNALENYLCPKCRCRCEVNTFRCTLKIVLKLFFFNLDILNSNKVS